MPQIYTIGHSNHSLDVFLDLLRAFRIGVIVDCRSEPTSTFSPHFQREPLQRAAREMGIGYLFSGRELGGRPSAREFYDADGHVLYGQIAQTPEFQGAISSLLRLAAKQPTVVMCSEEDPSSCHRRLLVGRVLLSRGSELLHIRGDGRLEKDEREQLPADQPALFGGDRSWRSTRSVLRRGRPPTSSRR